MKKLITFLSIAVALIALGIACQASANDGPPRNAEVINVIASTNLQGWLDEAAAEFNDTKQESPQGKRYYVQVSYMDAGQAASLLAEKGSELADVWVPDNQTWTEVLASLGNESYQENCASTAESPLVIAMWQPLAEALGWPGRKLGWLDIGSLAADPSAWAYYSGGQYGPTLRLGHAHPGLSAAGTNTLLAVVQSAQGQQNAVGVSDIEEPIVRASVTAFESSVATFAGSSLELGQLMETRGDSYLNASVVYENTVVEFQQKGLDLVPIYPFEGTYMADFPACVNAQAGEGKAAGGEAFRTFLHSQDGQALAAKHGLRKVIDDATVEAYEGAGLDYAMPEVVFDNPSVDTIFAVQDLWQSSRKAVNLVMIIDTSASMRGDKIQSVKDAAVDFVEAMGDTDYLTIVYYDSNNDIVPLVFHLQVEANRESIIAGIRRLTVQSSTPLYDSIGVSAQIISETTSSQTTNAMVVLTDGKDTASDTYMLDDSLFSLAASNNTAVYSIAFGTDAAEAVLEELALEANGNFYLGNQANIADIYREMSVLFGGNAGIGR